PELDTQVGMGEGRTVDDTLRRIVVDRDAFELGQKDIAVADAGPQVATGPCPLQRLLHPVFTQRMRARPFRSLPIGPSLHARLKRCLAAERRQQFWSSDRVVTGSD